MTFILFALALIALIAGATRLVRGAIKRAVSAGIVPDSPQR